MSPRAVLRLGLRSLLLHKLRSTLSILGVFFGVAAVVAISSVGEGARRQVLDQIGALGIDSITVRKRPSPSGEPRRLLMRDARSLEQRVPHLLGVAPVREAALPARFTSRLAEVTVVGTTPGYRLAARLPLAAGRFLSDLDLRDRKRSAVLGAWVARRLFPLEEALGEWVRVGGDWFQVVGVLEGRAPRKGKGGPIRMRDVNQSIFVPLLSLDHGLGTEPEGIDEVVMRVSDGRYVPAAAEVAKAVVEEAAGRDSFDILVPREILRQKERAQRIFNIVTGVIAGISLLVGGIGIMNIMLASVAERTREVGIRRALGATRREITAHFLVEATLLTLAGGLFGAVLGIVGSFVIQHLAGWPTALSPLMLLLALLMALGVGLGFGLYPAWHAAQLEPMEALRHE
jgi:putative ABC transport system permease protein